MSKLRKLINELCPNGVEYKALKDISLMERGQSITKAKSILGEYPVISGGKSPAFFCDKYNREGETITVASSGSAGYVQYFNKPVFANDCFTIKGQDKVNTKYLYYYLVSEQDYIYSAKKVGGVPHVYISDIENMKIPVPPLSIQEEIVRILDKMTDYITELKAELALQKEVFNYFKNKIFEKIDKKYYVPLNTIAKQERGKNKGQIIKDAFSVTQKGIIRTTDYFGEKTKITSENTSNYYVLKPGWFAYSPSRINVGSFNYLRVDYDVIISPLNKVFSVKREKIIPEFLYQYMTTTVGFSNMLKHREGIEGTGRWHLEFNDMAKMSIPLLPIEEQSEIVDKLQKFDILCNDISSGLPAEIEARQKQYEYYRDKLLSFRKLENEEY